MIFIDVTGGCLLPLQSGIPRTTRGVHQLIAEHFPEAVPLFWQPFRNAYTGLSPRAQSLLDNPFARRNPSERPPRDSTLPLLWASFSDLLGPWPRMVPLKRIMRPEDVLLLTSIFPDNRVEYLQRLASVPGRKIAIFHDAIPLRDPNVNAWEKGRHLKTLRLLSQMDTIIAVSQSAGTELTDLWKEHGITSRTSVAVLPWPVPFQGPRPAFVEPPGGRPRILYVSRLKETKNHATLFASCLKLWNQGLDFELDLIGCEDEARESRAIAKAIQQLREAGHPISWRGQVSEEELHEAYQRAFFTVFPSLAEGFGLPIIESFWHGRPVICGDQDAVGELARNGGCLTTDVRSPDRLAVSIQLLLQDSTRYQTLSQEAYARPLRSWSDYWRELKPLLENP